MKKLTIALAVLLLALLPSACQKEKTGNEQFSFNATAEAPVDYDAKVRIDDERFIMWEYDDEISIGSNMTTGGTEGNVAWLYHTANATQDWVDYNGVFLTTLPAGSEAFLGLYPHSTNNVIRSQGTSGNTFYNPVIELPAEQTYRDDHSFDRNVYPMVAWYGGSWANDPHTPFNLDFHSLAAIVRLQFLNSTGAASDIRTITITSADKQLCGLFTVNGYNTNDPYLTGNEASKKTVTINCGDGGVAFANNQLLSFYLVLPAIAGRDTPTDLTLTATVTNTAGQTCSRSFEATTRRNGITYANAMDITAWGNAPAEGITGNGTADRPFKIYTTADFIRLRDCYNSPERLINGQPIGEDTYIRIMTSKIKLSRTNWTAGINNFEGHMDFYGNAVDVIGISNNSGQPLFQTIRNTGHVTGITIRCDTSYTYSGDSFSPFCITNNGTITDCRVTSNNGEDGIRYLVNTSSEGLAGICVTNNGTIRGCGSQARFYCTDHTVAGICFTNNGTIEGCYASTPMVATAANAAGICAFNSGTIRDSYFAVRLATTASPSPVSWSGIAYRNNGTLEHCYTSNTAAIITSANTAGIAAINYGVIDHCWNDAPLTGRMVGGIAISNHNGGAIRNSYCNDELLQFVLLASSSPHYAGGIVASIASGTIENCYVTISDISTRDNTGYTGAIVGYISGGTIINSYAYEVLSVNHRIYGHKVSGTLNGVHLVDGTQDGATSVTPDAAGFNSLFGSLQAAAAANDAYDEWQQPAPGERPVLVPYSITAK